MPFTPDMVKEVRERAHERSMEISHELIVSQLGVYDTPLTRGARIERFIDFAQRGVLDALRVVKPKLYRELIRDYQRDVAAEMRA